MRNLKLDTPSTKGHSKTCWGVFFKLVLTPGTESNGRGKTKAFIKKICKKSNFPVCASADYTHTEKN